MAASTHRPGEQRPVTLIVSGEARSQAGIIQQLLGPALVSMFNVADTGELLHVVQRRQVDGAVVDSEVGDGGEDLLKTLRIIRRIDAKLPVVLVASSLSRRFLEGALRLEAFSVVRKPMQREELLIQLRRIVERVARN